MPDVSKRACPSEPIAASTALRGQERVGGLLWVLIERSAMPTSYSGVGVGRAWIENSQKNYRTHLTPPPHFPYGAARFNLELAMQPAVYLVFCEDLLVSSNADGSVQRVVITPKKYWGLGLNLSEFLAGLRIKNLTANGGITIKWQWSLDGKSWKMGAPVITEKSVDDDYTGLHSLSAEQTPFTRLLLEVRDTTSAGQKTAEVTVWGYYRYRV